MINLVNQNNHHARKHTFTSNGHLKKLHSCDISKGCTTLLENRRKAYIVDVICNRFDFVEVREVVHAMSMVSHHPDQKVCLYISDLFLKKRSRVVEEMPL